MTETKTTTNTTTTTPKMKNITVEDIKLSVDPDAFNDFELYEMLGKVDENIFILPKVLEKIVGTDQKAKVLEALRDSDTGRVTATKGSAFVVKLVEAIAPKS